MTGTVTSPAARFYRIQINGFDPGVEDTTMPEEIRRLAPNASGRKVAHPDERDMCSYRAG